MKTVACIVLGRGGAGESQELELERGTTAGDVLRALGMSPDQYVVTKENSSVAYASDEQIYEDVPEAGKLRIAPVAAVGVAELSAAEIAVLAFIGLWILLLLGLIFGQRSRAKRQARAWERYRPTARTVSRYSAPTGRVRAGVDRRPLWQARGWRRQGEKLVGAFRTPLGACRGEIMLDRHLRPREFYIFSPPKTLLRGPHAACFRRRGGDRYWVHFAIPAATIDAGVVQLEDLLQRALRGR